ncbi:MAG: hypothetical protein JO356_17985 [Acidobacteria bacterium]|nr:hypothetical protein [Acidobacteriota bacterium]
MPPPQAPLLAKPERRAVRRFPLKLPAMVRVYGVPYDFPVQTENISAWGLFFYIERIMNAGIQIEVTMNFSAKITMTSPLKILFFGRILRVDQPKRSIRAGVAAIIEQYDCLPLSEEPRSFAQPEPSPQLSA